MDEPDRRGRAERFRARKLFTHSNSKSASKRKGVRLLRERLSRTFRTPRSVMLRTGEYRDDESFFLKIRAAFAGHPR